MESMRTGVAWSSEQVPWNYVRLSPRTAPAHERGKLREAYACWRRVWRETFRELDGSDALFSDDFTRQDEIGALFSGAAGGSRAAGTSSSGGGGECIGLTGFRWIDLSEPSARDDSYFKAWPSAVLDEVRARATKVCIGSNLTVADAWRGSQNGPRVSEVLLEMAVRRFRESNAEVMLGTMRNNRGMNRVSYSLGARPLLERVMHHGVEVDLVVFGRASTPCIWCAEASRARVDTTQRERGVCHEIRA